MYKALYRRYRPRGFESVVGQDSIVKTLKNSVKCNNFGHAYMFFGPRGVGKTTISKILARSINCLDNIDGEACGKCKNCINSADKNCVDIIEIDAASNNGVDEIRELRSKVNLVPSFLKYKVYIIDEVHMLSVGAFNALLKTLEEPPEHIVFILATTDPQKVPETIISRCLCFSFKRISNEALINRLRFVCEKENIDIEEEVLKQIAIFSEGGMRDALGMLDKLHSYTDSRITYDDFCELNSVVNFEELNAFVSAIMKNDFTFVLTKIQKFSSDGKNLVQILSQLMYFLRDLVVDYYINKTKLKYDFDFICDLINFVNEKMFDIKRSGDVKLYVEMMLLTFMQNRNNNEIISREIKCYDNNEKLQADDFIHSDNVDLNVNVINRLENNDIHEISHSEENNVLNFSKIHNIDEIIRVRVNNTLAEADKNMLKEDLQKISSLSEYSFDSEVGYLVCAILDGKLRASSRNNLIISYEYDSVVNQNLLILPKINEVYNNLTHSDKRLAIISDKEWDKQKEDYISSIKSGKKYTIIHEPEEVFEDLKKDDIIVSSAVELFGDIVEVE